MIYCKPVPYQIKVISCIMPVFQSRKADQTEQEFNIHIILTAVSNGTGVKVYEIKSQSRERDIVEARRLAIHFICQFNPDITLKKIGSIFSNLDHSTVIYNKTKAQNFIDIKDKRFTAKYLLVKDRLMWLKKETKKSVDELINRQKVA